ncbi:MAG TPA: c-type cytochrome [Bryobacteraceae bacterium]|nr:c-type cytochrome [Bryobacteraceae bacterium]
MRLHLLCVIAMACLAAWAADDKGDAKNPLAGQPEAIAAGKKLFVEGCSGCHGPNGEGGRGPNLAKGDLIRGATDAHLFSAIRNGVPGSDMPPFRMPDEKIWQLVTFIRSLSAPAYESTAPGNPEAGGALFFGQSGCVQCHTIRGRGGVLGPDLSNIGRTRSYAQLREALLDPDAHPTEGFRGVSVLTKDGRTISGVAKDNTNYSIAVLDAQGNLHLLWKKDLREVTFHQKSLMPHDYKQRLSRDQMQDLLAFLGRQSVRVDVPGDEAGPKGDH